MAGATHYIGILREQLLAAVGAFDFTLARRLLDRAEAQLDRRELAIELLPSLLLEVGEQWASGALCVAQEHATSVAVRDVLGPMLRDSLSDGTGPLAVAATPQGERHEFGAMLAAVVATTLGWRALYLGPDLPAREVAVASQRCGAAAVLLSAVSIAPERLLHEVRTLRDALGWETELVLGGQAALDARRPLRELARVTDLLALEDALRPPDTEAGIPSPS